MTNNLQPETHQRNFNQFVAKVRDKTDLALNVCVESGPVLNSMNSVIVCQDLC